jgi:hypothetical protein
MIGGGDTCLLECNAAHSTKRQLMLWRNMMPLAASIKQVARKERFNPEAADDTVF